MDNQQIPPLKKQLEAIKKGKKRRSMDNIRLKKVKNSFKTKKPRLKAQLTDLLP